MLCLHDTVCLIVGTKKSSKKSGIFGRGNRTKKFDISSLNQTIESYTYRWIRAYEETKSILILNAK